MDEQLGSSGSSTWTTAMLRYGGLIRVCGLLRQEYERAGDRLEGIPTGLPGFHRVWNGVSVPKPIVLLGF